MERIIKLLDGTTLHIKNEFIELITRYIQKDNIKEAGGVLFGTYAPDDQCYTLCDISEPTSLAKRSRTGFVRSKKSHQIEINKKWETSGGIVNYMGEWHTHPAPNPTPSDIDRELIRQIIRDHSNVYPKVFLAILGSDFSLYIGVADSTVSYELIFTHCLTGE